MTAARIVLTKLLKIYLEANPSVPLPRENTDLVGKLVRQTIIERLWHICDRAQSDEIRKQLPYPQLDKSTPPESQARILKEYQEKYDSLLRSGVGREKLIERRPDFRDPENILNELKHRYEENARDAGNYAHKYIGINPFTSMFPFHTFSDSEEFKEVNIPGIGKPIAFQYDLEDTDAGLYEFKLTHSNYLDRKLKYAFVQLLLYDFLFRISEKTLAYQGLHIEICLIDKEHIRTYIPTNQFGKNMTAYKKYMLEVAAPIIDAVLKLANPQDPQKVSKTVFSIYENLRPAIEEDHELSLSRHL